MSKKVAWGPIALALPATGTVATPWMPVESRHLDLEIAWTGTPVGVFSLQRSYDGGATAKTVQKAQIDFTSDGNAQPAGSANSMDLNWTNVPGGLWRILYTATSSTGTANVRPSKDV